MPRATKSQIIRIYESLIKRNALAAFDELTGNAAIYGELLRPPERLSDSLADGLVELQRIGASPAYQILLYLFSLPMAQLEPNDFLPRAVNLLCRYYIRRSVTDTPATREACAQKISQDGFLAFDTFTSLLLEGRSRPASIDQFRSTLEGPIYAENTYMARYLLIQIDRLHHTREYKPDLWARDDKDRFVWTIEHVLPQAEKLPAHWVQMIAEGDTTKAAALQSAHVDQLGNLTLSGYNSDLATSPFSKKQLLAEDRTFLGHKINIGYRNGLALNNLSFELDGKSYSLGTAPAWSVDRIRARTKAMVDLLISANKLPGESVQLEADVPHEGAS